MENYDMNGFEMCPIMYYIVMDFILQRKCNYLDLSKIWNNSKKSLSVQSIIRSTL